MNRFSLLLASLFSFTAGNSAAQVTALEWVHSFGNNLFEYGSSITVDTMGNIIVTGNFSGAVDFDPGIDTAALVATGGEDIFFAKYGSDGSFIYAKQISCTGTVRATCITTDGSGNVYLTGFFSLTTNFNPVSGTDTATAAGIYDTFFAKYDAVGNLVWVKSIASSTFIIARGIHAAADGNVYLTGDFEATADFDPDSGSAVDSSNGGSDFFIAKYDNQGNYSWVRTSGGQSADSGAGLETDANGNVYATGHFASFVDFNPGPATAWLFSQGSSDVFLARYDSSGNFSYVKQITSPGLDKGRGIVIDGNHDIVLTGLYSQNPDFDPGPGSATTGIIGDADIFIAKYDTLGNFIFAGGIGSPGYDEVSRVFTDGLNNIYITGTLPDTADADPGNGTAFLNGAGGEDAFFAAYDTQGDFLWAEQIAGTGTDGGFGIAVDGNGAIFVSGGYSDSVDFNPGQGSYPLQAVMNTDIYLAKYFRCTADTFLIADVTCSNFLFDGLLYPSPGNYLVPGYPAIGCDSVVVIDLTLPVIDTTVSVAGVTLTANALGVTYQWIDCTNGNIPLPGDTGQSLTANSNGSYAVILSGSGCSDTSGCVIVNNVGISENTQGYSISVYPNPANNEFSVLLDGMKGKYVKIQLYDMYGMLIQSLMEGIVKMEQFQLTGELGRLPLGVYFIRLYSGARMNNLKIVKI